MRTCTSQPRSGERNRGIADYPCEVAANPISTSITRESIFLSAITCMTIQGRHGCCVRSELDVTNSSATSCGFLTCRLWTLWNFSQETKDFLGVVARCWQLGLPVGVRLPLSIQLLEQSPRQVCRLSFPAVFSLFKVLESQSAQIKEFMHFGIEETALEKLSNCSGMDVNQGLRIAQNMSGWGAEKPGRVSEYRGRVTGKHYLI